MSVSSQSGVFGLKRQSAAGQTAKGPYNGSGTTDIQTLVITGTPTSGGYKLAFPFPTGTETTALIAYNATNSAIQTAVQALPSIGSGNLLVTGSSPTFTLTAASALLGRNVPQAIITGVTFDTGSIASATTQDGGTWYWLPALNVAFQPNQMVQSIPPEVGGSLWSRGSYKGGVYGGGQVTMVPRGGLGLAELLYAFCGGTIVNTAVAADYTAGTGGANKLTGDGTNGIPAGVFKYRFRPDKTPGATLPWYTFIRNIGGKFVEEFPDGHLGSFAFDLAATGILQVDGSFVSRACETIAKGSGAASVGAQIAGNGLPFQMVDAVVQLDTNVTANPGALAVNTDYNPTRLNIGFNNELTQNEFVVGSFFLQDITNISRSAQISYSLYLRDAEIYNRVYNHGAAAADGSTGSAWSSQIWKGKLNVSMAGGQIASSGTNYNITVDIPEMDYQAAPISLAGNNLVEYQLTTNVVLSTNTAVDPFTIEYTTDENISS
jgi:hypothetical protein